MRIGKPAAWKCPHCGRAFSQQVDLARHIRMYHTRHRP